MKLRVMLAAVLGCLMLFSMPSLALAQNVVVPNALANVEGNVTNVYPFSIGGSLATQRYQQVYASSEFSDITGPTMITAISFRPDSGGGGSFNTTLPSMQINLSTTATGPDGLSATFASNMGGNNTLVYSGALTLSSTNTGGPPRNFDIVITLQTPFLYDPANGNLLMDVSNFGAGTTTVMDAHLVGGDSISRVLTTTSGVGSATADVTDSFGLVTQFTFAAVPEPATIALVSLSIIGSAGFAYLRKGKTQLALDGKLR